MSKRRVISDSPARRATRISPPSQSARSSACVIRTGRAVCGYWTRTLSSPALAMTMKPPSRRTAMAGKGVLESRDQSVRQARALSPRSLAHRSISGAPIFVVPSRCLICSRSAATPCKCRSVTRDSSPGSAGLALSVSVLTCVLRGSLSPQACGCARTGCGSAAASAIGAAPWPSPAVTKLDAMNWPSKAAADGVPTGAWMTTPLPGPWLRTSTPGPPIRTSSPASPFRMSSPALPISTSAPSPPLAVSCMPVRPVAVTTSSPPRPLMTRWSLVPKLEIDTVSARPVTVTTPLLVEIVIASL